MEKTEISKYQNCEIIGEGKSGEIFRTTCPDENEPRAIKRLNSMAIDREFLECNYRRHAQAPRHPGVVHVSDYQFGQTPYYLAMDWIEAASTLESIPVPMPEAEAWPIIYELADSMAHLHKHGVRHGNLHPGNVFVTEDSESRTQITDFGTGLSGKIHHIDIAETAWFAAPEQLENPENIGDGAMERWDVYRFGALVFWLLNGDVPRGQSYAEAREEAVAASGDRPVPYDLMALAEDVRRNADYHWKTPADLRANELRREIIDRCLAIDPTERPVDMREIQEAFEKLETRFSLEEAELRVVRERERQAGKLRFSRSVAACLTASLLAASTFLVLYLNRSKSFQNRVGELGLVIDSQRLKLEDFESRWSRSLHELSESRAAADSFFSQISRSGVGDLFLETESTAPRVTLEKSRTYFENTLKGLADTPQAEIERARCLHHLANVEAQLGQPDSARARFLEAVALFESIAKARPGESTLISEFELRLADCHEHLSGLIEADPSDEMLETLQQASRYFGKARERRPEDREIGMRQLMADFKLGCQLHAHREYDAAFDVFASAGESLDGLREDALESEILSEMLSRIQYHAALSLRELDRASEAIDSHLASMETIALSADGRSYTADQQRRLAQSYIELGELFSEQAGENANETKSLFNEALRLLTPLCESGQTDMEAVAFLSRSMAHIARFEREGARWSDGYKMSLAAIRKLEEALETSPDHIDCLLALSAIRASHTEMLKYNESAALACLDKGLNMIIGIQDRIDRDVKIIEPVRHTWRLRIAKIYDDYKTVCESIGESEKAQMCSDRASEARDALVLQEGEEERLSF